MSTDDGTIQTGPGPDEIVTVPTFAFRVERGKDGGRILRLLVGGVERRYPFSADNARRLSRQMDAPSLEAASVRDIRRRS